MLPHSSYPFTLQIERAAKRHKGDDAAQPVAPSELQRGEDDAPLQLTLAKQKPPQPGESRA